MKRDINEEACVIKVVDPCAMLPIDRTRPLEIEVGCGAGTFLVRRAAANPDCEFLGIERMLGRVRSIAGKCRRAGIGNLRVLRLEALYTFHYLLPKHCARKVFVFFPDPWPKRKHKSHRLFGPRFLDALWMTLEQGGRLEFATDHAEYFGAVREWFAADARFGEVAPMPRPPEVWTEFETEFRSRGMPIYSAAWQTLEWPDAPEKLPPLAIPPEAEPREGVQRRCQAFDIC